ncbi:MAG TPA: hypothetical protein VHM92_11535 [Allosphingosinicella sp.]|nr:hypothetical protein [Allosphingosinicella sp.]
MRAITLDDFRGRIGETFPVEHEGEEVPLVLSKAVPLPNSARDGQAFRLDWRGPRQPLLAQGIYAFRSGEERLEIFIVPVGEDADGISYEAIFN